MVSLIIITINKDDDDADDNGDDDNDDDDENGIAMHWGTTWGRPSQVQSTTTHSSCR